VVTGGGEPGPGVDENCFFLPASLRSGTRSFLLIVAMDASSPHAIAIGFYNDAHQPVPDFSRLDRPGLPITEGS